MLSSDAISRAYLGEDPADIIEDALTEEALRQAAYDEGIDLEVYPKDAVLERLAWRLYPWTVEGASDG